MMSREDQQHDTAVAANKRAKEIVALKERLFISRESNVKLRLALERLIEAVKAGEAVSGAEALGAAEEALRNF